MIDSFAFLSEDELHELSMFLLYEVDSDEVMTIDALDGYLHAIALAPVTIQPRQWLPRLWGLGTVLPPSDSIDRLNHILSLVMRHFNGIIVGLESEPREISPTWSMLTYDSNSNSIDP